MNTSTSDGCPTSSPLPLLPPNPKRVAYLESTVTRGLKRVVGNRPGRDGKVFGSTSRDGEVVYPTEEEEAKTTNVHIMTRRTRYGIS